MCATCCNTLQHIVMFMCCTLRHAAIRCSTLLRSYVAHCNTRQHAATRYIIFSLSYVAHWNTLEHIVIFICCTLQHTAPHGCVDMRDATRAFVRDDSIVLVTWLMHMLCSNASCCAHVMPHITHTNASMYVLAFVRIRICMYICVCICNECVMPHITHTNASCHLCNLAFLPVLP